MKWKINLKAALEKRRIENGNELWLKIGGSKETAYNLFNGTVKMIRLETFDRLEDVLGITPYEILIKDKSEK
jgi:DNA-binding Xre family transcriptional regulator